MMGNGKAFARRRQNGQGLNSFNGAKVCSQRIELRLCSLSLLMLITLVALAFTLLESPNSTWRTHINNEANADQSSATIITVVGFRTCSYFQQAKEMLDYAEQQPHLHGIDKQVVALGNKEEFKKWLKSRHDHDMIPVSHTSSPCVFTKAGENGKQEFLGGLHELSMLLKTRYSFINWSLFETRAKELASMGKSDVNEIQTGSSSTNGLRKKKKRSESGTLALVTVPAITKPQLIFKGRKVLTSLRLFEGRSVTNYKNLRQILIAKGWTYYANQANMANAVFVQDQSSAQAAQKRNKNALVNNIGWGGQSCYGGTKGAQLRCRIELAEKHGCSYDSLGFQPPQYRMWFEDECTEFFTNICPEKGSGNDDNDDDDEDNANPSKRMWIEKPSGGQHGVGMHVHQGCEKLRNKYSKCRSSESRPKKFFIMEYIDPALLSGHKFDVRSYLVVVSLDPLLVFYHDGFVRRATSPFSSDVNDQAAHITNAVSQDSSNDHFWDFGRLEDHLQKHAGFPEGFMRKTFRRHALKVENFVFQAARDNMYRRKATYQIFALDWIVDSAGGIHMLEANSNPLVTNYPIPGYPGTWEVLMDLVIKVHSSPAELGPMTVGMSGSNGRSEGSGPQGAPFQFGDWILIFNEDEEKAVGSSYNPCEVFKNAGANIPKRLSGLTPQEVEKRLKRAAEEAFEFENERGGGEEEEKEDESGRQDGGGGGLEGLVVDDDDDDGDSWESGSTDDDVEH